MKNSNEVIDLYLDLLMKCLTDTLSSEYYNPNPKIFPGDIGKGISALMRKLLASRSLEIVKREKLDMEQRMEGKDWPAHAETMIGLKRMENLKYCIQEALSNNVPGDFIETGVWRGGSTIFMRAVLKAYGVTDRIVWVADSFEGLPRPDAEKYPLDHGDRHWTYNNLKVSLEDVKSNFEKYSMLDGQVKFLKGWFKDTLNEAPIDKLAVIRLDGDMYESTMDAVKPLYPKLSPGGFLIVDDYGLPGCKQAIEDYRKEHGITDTVQKIDYTGVFWQKSK